MGYVEQLAHMVMDCVCSGVSEIGRFWDASKELTMSGIGTEVREIGLRRCYSIKITGVVVQRGGEVRAKEQKRHGETKVACNTDVICSSLIARKRQLLQRVFFFVFFLFF